MEKAFGLIYTGESNNQLRDITYSRLAEDTAA